MTPAAIIITVVAAIVAATVVLIVRGVVSAQQAADEVQRLREERRKAGPFGALVIRPLGTEDKAAWEKLWYAYCDFYDEAVPQPVTDETWRRIHDPDLPIRGYGAYDGGVLLGIAHVVLHPHTWSTKTVCYLEDLFVDPAARGGGTGRALIHAVYEAADATGAAGVYWLTQEYNADGRALYDTLARRTSFIRYQR